MATLGPLGQETDVQDNDPVTTPSPPLSFPGYVGTPGNITLTDEALLPSATPPSSSWKGAPALGLFSLPSFHELPPKSVALGLVDETFRSFLSFFPLFDNKDFLRQFHVHYASASPRRDPGWWACINVVLSMAHRFRAMRTLETTFENAQSCGYIHNALAVVSELNILQNSLPAVQALVAMAIILQGMPNSHSSSVLIAATVRLAQATGLHRRVHDPRLTEEQAEQRRRVFWIAYLLDKDVSLRMGQPYAQDDEDMDVELPSGTLPVNGLGTVGFFHPRIGLAVIQGQVYEKLYSVQATRQSEAHRATTAHELKCVLSYCATFHVHQLFGHD